MRSERVLILGTGPRAQAAAKALDEGGQADVVGFVQVHDDGALELALGADKAVLGDSEQLDELVREHKPRRIVVALTERRTRLPLTALLRVRSSGILVEDWVVACEGAAKRLDFDSMSPSHVLFASDLKQSKLTTGAIRLVSLAMSAFGLTLAVLFLLLPIALLIKLESRGPVFFTQRRVGRFGREFKMFKFRTMTVAPEEENSTDEVWSRDDRARVTRLGRILRMFYIDEVPQLYNVLIGDMNLVGPRPEMAVNVEHMNAQVPYFALRNLVRPGLTGWAQVNTGYSVSRLAVTDKTAYDLYYVKNRSLWFDLLIIRKTFGTVLSGWHGGNAHAVPEMSDSDSFGDILIPSPAGGLSGNNTPLQQRAQANETEISLEQAARTSSSVPTQANN